MMNWTCSTNNIVMLYLSLELTTLATAFLVIFYGKRSSIEAGYKYLMLVTVGILCALMGVALIYSAAAGLPKGETQGLHLLLISDLAKTAPKMAPSLVLLANAFLIAGFGTKAGLVPFHAWLPDAHAEAPEPISALLSGHRDQGRSLRARPHDHDLLALLQCDRDLRRDHRLGEHDLRNPHGARAGRPEADARLLEREPDRLYRRGARARDLPRPLRRPLPSGQPHA